MRAATRAGKRAIHLAAVLAPRPATRPHQITCRFITSPSTVVAYAPRGSSKARRR